jgi:FMN-dependent NADH-azoreductase
MSKIIYVKANPKTAAESGTFKISEAFMEAYKQAHPGDEVVIRDLYQENILPLSQAELKGLLGGHEAPFFDYSREFAGADRIVIAAPMWNLSIPSILKAYIDRVVISGLTFKYTDKGPVGLLAGRGMKAVHITSRGGMYAEGPAAAYEMGDKYLRTIFGFMGITDFITIPFEGTGMLPAEALQPKLAETVAKARKSAETF